MTVGCESRKELTSETRAREYTDATDRGGFATGKKKKKVRSVLRRGERERRRREKGVVERVFVRARFRRLTFRLRTGRDATRDDDAVSSGDDRNPSRNNSISGRTTTDYTTTTTPTFREEPIDSLRSARPGAQLHGLPIEFANRPESLVHH